MRKRWKIAIGAGVLLLALVAAPVAYIEGMCRGPMPGVAASAPYRPLLAAPADRRPEARTFLTYPEWHIVYSAESFGRHLRSAPPSRFSYGREIIGFWSSYCALNKVTAGAGEAGDAKVMIYTIGISYTAELALKSLYENVIGYQVEYFGGWRSADDAYSAGVQQRYGEFMHETPWYAFPFGEALAGLWRTDEPAAPLRHWERRLALSAEYGAKSLYARLIGWASGATLGRDEVRLRMVVRGDPSAVDPRFRVVRAGQGLTVVDAPRYAQLTELLVKLASAGLDAVEIAANDDIFLTVLVPERVAAVRDTQTLLSLRLEDRPGWRRLGLSTKVPRLSATIRAVRAAGGEIEHVYDY